MRQKEDVDEEAEYARIQQQVRQWKAEAEVTGKPFKLPRMPLLLRDIWMGALLLFTILAFSTFFINTVAGVSLVRIISCAV
jgi:solute carrier family 45, member 1/2/4